MFNDELKNENDNYAFRLIKDGRVIFYTSTRISNLITVVGNDIEVAIPAIDYDSMQLINIEQKRVINEVL